MKEMFKKLAAHVINLVEFIVFKHPIPSKIVLAILTCLSFCLLAGWKVGLVALAGMILHEYGHILALDMIGIRHAGFFGIPFFGGITIYSAEDIKKYSHQFFIAIMGPVVGALFGGALVLAYIMTGLNAVGATAGLMIILNLFNMIPVIGLDGGAMYDCIVSGFHPVLKKISFGLLAAAVAGTGAALIHVSLVLALPIIALAIITLILRVVRQPTLRFEPMSSPFMVLGCVVAFMAAVMGMLTMLYPLVNVNFIEFIK